MCDIVTTDTSSDGVHISLQHSYWRTLVGELYVEQLASILEKVLRANEVLNGLSVNDFEARRAGFAAQDLRLQILMNQVIQQANLLVAVADGSESMADHGFPEFGNDE